MKTLPAIALLAAGIAIGALITTGAHRSMPAPPAPAPAPAANTQPPAPSSDTDLVHSLLAQNLSTRRFDFPTIVQATSGKQILPLNDSPAQQRVISAIETALSQTLAELNQPDSPVRKLRRINEASRFFEDGLMEKLDALPDLTCEIPPNRDGNHQRSGYPDLRITDNSSGLVFYLDPKLVEQKSLDSTLRSFYFAPKTNTLKITDDASHLLVGITHDGNTGAWTFTGWKLVDLSNLRVRLKAEFQASNADLYKSPLSIPDSSLTPE
ncbi:MAG: hypothetical protein ACQCXQ_10870 [Verrucomicrobiales bacterium]|nr:hypothetical protein [Verrucomicrobiota bacterium JB025]